MLAEELIQKVCEGDDPKTLATHVADKFGGTVSKTTNVDGDKAWTAFFSKSTFNKAYKYTEKAFRTGDFDGFAPDEKGKYGISFWI